MRITIEQQLFQLTSFCVRAFELDALPKYENGKNKNNNNHIVNFCPYSVHNDMTGRKREKRTRSKCRRVSKQNK